MNYPHTSLLACACILVPLSSTFLIAQEEDVDAFELSPFAVSGEQDEGYRATSTLAGTRIRTPLRDVGSAVSVLTEEFFQDTGATDAETVLGYSLNTEVGGVHGNFADGLGGNNNGRAEQDEQRLNPQSSQRVRGLAEASLTRNFFLTDIPFDSYNTSRVDINRGANSLLFGVGSPGGIINNTVHQASAHGADFGEVSVRIGERSSHRETADYHKVIIQDRLAIRVSGLYEDTQFRQQPAYEKDERLHGAFEGVLFENENSSILGPTFLRGNVEIGRIQANPPNIVPPTDSYTSFFEMPDPSLANVPGVVYPGWITQPEEDRAHPSVGISGMWVPRSTYDTRVGLNRGNVPAMIERPLDRPIFISFPDRKAEQASVGLGGNPQIGAMSGTLYASSDGRTPTPNGTFNYIWTNSFFGGNRNGQMVPNFTTPVTMDRAVWDNENHLITGSTNWREQRFDVQSFALEQALFDGSGGIELAYDRQDFEQEASLPFSYGETVGDNGAGDIKIDVSEYLGTGEPNPNVGRPVMASTGIPNNLFSSTKRESYRATAFYELNLGEKVERFPWLGRHIFTAFYNEQKIENLDRNHEGVWVSDEIDVGASPYLNSALQTGPRRTNIWVYMGPSVLDPSITSPSQVRIDGPIDVRLPTDGEVVAANVWNRETQSFEQHNIIADSVLLGGGMRKQELDTNVLSWQGRFFNDHIVGLYGWREDKTKTFENITSDNTLGIPQRLPSGEINPDFIRLQDVAGNKSDGQTRTWSVVAHVPENWLGSRSPVRLSGHYSESENFQPSATRRDVRGRVLAPPSGVTEEMGFTLESKDQRFSARFNWYETTSNGASVALGTASGAITVATASGLNRWLEARDAASLTIDEAVVAAGGTAGQFSSYDEVFGHIIDFLPEDIQAVYQFRVMPDGSVESEPNPGMTATRDFVSEGFELDLVANLTPNWRVMLNVGKQESVQDNTGRVLQEVVTQIAANIAASPLSGLQDTPHRDENQTFNQRYHTQVVAPLAATTARDGTLALELREWRVNAVTTYDIREGPLDGFGFGGAIRWQSKNAVGYPNILNEDGNAVPDLANPFYGPDQTNGDLWISYGRALSDRVDWKIQLNVRNAFGDDDPIPVVINPDGNLAVVRNPNPTTIFLTNTFRF